MYASTANTLKKRGLLMEHIISRIYELLNETEKYAMEMDVKTIDLFVTEENLAAVKMYEDLGYITERRYLKKII